MGWVINATLRPLYLRERPGTHCVEGWVGPQGRSGRVRKISPPPEFEPRTVQPVACRYTDSAFPAIRKSSITNEINLRAKKKAYLVTCLVCALCDGTNVCSGCESGDTHYAARDCVKRHSLQLMSRDGVIRTRRQWDRDRYMLELHGS